MDKNNIKLSDINDTNYMDFINKLITDKQVLFDENKELVVQIDKLFKEKEALENYIASLKKNRFGTKSEKSRQNLFSDHEESFDNKVIKNILPNEIEAINENVKSYVEKFPASVEATKDNLTLSLERLEFEDYSYDLEEHEKLCSCGCGLHFIKTITASRLKYMPAKYITVKEKQAVYGCRICQEEFSYESTAIVTAKKDEDLFSGSKATPSLVAKIATDKFYSHLPLYRQEQIFIQNNIPLNRQNMSNWLSKLSKAINPLMLVIKDEIKTCKVVHADETTFQVLKEPGRKASQKGYIWLYSSNLTGKKLAYYDYQPTRSSDHPIKFFKDYNGYIMSDGLQQYNLIKNIVNMSCMAHIRRKFVETSDVSKGNSKEIALRFVAKYNSLYEIERQAKGLSSENIKKIREKFSLPVLEEIKQDLNKLSKEVVPSSSLGGSINYALNNHEGAMVYLLDGELPICNNFAERRIKTVVMNRKNVLFCNTLNGMNESAVFYTIVESAKLNNLKIYDYLMHLMENYEDLKNNPKTYLPNNKKIISKFKINSNKTYE